MNEVYEGEDQMDTFEEGSYDFAKLFRVDGEQILFQIVVGSDGIPVIKTTTRAGDMIVTMESPVSPEFLKEALNEEWNEGLASSIAREIFESIDQTIAETRYREAIEHYTANKDDYILMA